MSYIGGSRDTSVPKNTLRSLINRKLVQYHAVDCEQVVPTTLGRTLVLTLYHDRVVDLSVSTFGLSVPPIVVEETLARVSLEQLPIYLTHKESRVREIARRVMEDANGTN